MSETKARVTLPEFTEWVAFQNLDPADHEREAKDPAQLEEEMMGFFKKFKK